MLSIFLKHPKPLFFTGLVLLAAMAVNGEALLLKADFDDDAVGPPCEWVLEGTGTVVVKDGALHLRETPDGVGAVLWTRMDWPADIKLSFDVRFSNNQGIGVLFLAAKASDGGDIFRDSAPRTGAYDEYIRGAVDSYSLSFHRYWPDGRNNPGSNLRRNSGFHLLSQALPDPCLEAGRTYRMEILKSGAHLRVIVDGIPVHDAVDNGELGPVHGAGKIGFRVRGHESCVMSLDNIRIGSLEESDLPAKPLEQQ